MIKVNLICIITILLGISGNANAQNDMLDKKQEVITVRVTPKEKETIQEKADKVGLSISSFVRMLALKEWFFGKTYNQKRRYGRQL